MEYVSTWGAADAEAYITLVEAETLIAKHSIERDTWDNVADEDDKVAAIIMAADQFQAHRWAGRKFSELQALTFPRVRDDDASHERSVVGSYTNDFLTLQMRRVKLANALQALFVIMNPEDPHREQYLRGMRSRSRSNRFGESYGYGDVPSPLCPGAWDQLRYYKATGPRIVRGGGALPSGAFE